MNWQFVGQMKYIVLFYCDEQLKWRRQKSDFLSTCADNLSYGVDQCFPNMNSIGNKEHATDKSETGFSQPL
jgi:hypothetical protein